MNLTFLLIYSAYSKSLAKKFLDYNSLHLRYSYGLFTPTMDRFTNVKLFKIIRTSVVLMVLFVALHTSNGEKFISVKHPSKSLVLQSARKICLDQNEINNEDSPVEKCIKDRRYSLKIIFLILRADPRTCPDVKLNPQCSLSYQLSFSGR